MSSELSNLANAGLAGVAIVAILSLVFVVKRFVDFIANHIEHHTQVNQKLVDAIGQLIRWLEKNNK